MRAAVAVVLLYLLWRLTRQLAVRARIRAEQHRASESFAFKQLARACTEKDASKAYHAMLAWLDRLEPELDAHRVVSDYGDEDLGSALASLSEHLYREPPGQLDLHALLRSLETARERYKSRETSGSRALVPPLNP